MKKFEFRLASVLRVKEAILKAEKNKLQNLLAERAKLQKNLASIADERKESSNWLHGSSGVASGDLRALSAFLLGSKSREATLKQAIQSCNEEINEQQHRTVIAERNQKLLLNLKDKKRTEWQHEFDHELELIAQEAWQSAARSRERE